jgi:hypothetical protein
VGEDQMRYEQPEAGEWIQPIRRGYKMRCCDCGLAHRLDFRVIEATGKKIIGGPGRVAGRRFIPQFRAYRDNSATAAIRRKRERAKEGGK